VRLGELDKVEDGNINPESLRAVGVIPQQTKTVKIILSGSVSTACTVSGCRVTNGAKAAIEAAGGTVAEISA
jgi:large subunit ribosomal protein L15